MKKLLSLLAICYTLYAICPKLAYADTNCQSIYGGGQSCGPGNLTVQKQVLKPGTSNDYVDSLGYNDAKYQPTSPIFFKITITNTTNNTLNNLVVTDSIDPQHEFLNFVSAPGNFDQTKKTLTYKIQSLTPGQQHTVIIAGNILSKQNLPTNQAVICAGNMVSVTVNNGAPTSALSAYCIQNGATQPTATPVQNIPVQQQTTKGGIPINQVFQPTATPVPASNAAPQKSNRQNFPVYTPNNTMNSTPKSGPEALPLLAMLPAGGLGFWLRKKAK